MGVGSDNRRPLEKKLIAPIRFFLAYLVVKKTVLKAQSIKFTYVPSEERRVTQRLFPGLSMLGA